MTREACRLAGALLLAGQGSLWAASPPCELTGEPLTGPAGQFSAALCEPQADGRQEIRLHWQQAAADHRNSVWLSASEAQALVDEPRLRLWGERLLTLELPAERGGSLLLANWNGSAFAISRQAYAGGDEEVLQQDWRDGVLRKAPVA